MGCQWQLVVHTLIELYYPTGTVIWTICKHSSHWNSTLQAKSKWLKDHLGLYSTINYMLVTFTLQCLLLVVIIGSQMMLYWYLCTRFQEKLFDRGFLNTWYLKLNFDHARTMKLSSNMHKITQWNLSWLDCTVTWVSYQTNQTLPLVILYRTFQKLLSQWSDYLPIPFIVHTDSPMDSLTF